MFWCIRADGSRLPWGKRQQGCSSPRWLSDLTKTPCGEAAHGEAGGLIDGEIGDDFPGDRGEAEAHHGVAGGDQDVLMLRGSADVGHAIGRYGT